MSKKLDFYIGNKTSRSANIDYSKETQRHIGNKRLGLIIALLFAFLADVFVAILLGLVTKNVKYFLAPIGLALVDFLFLLDVGFFINLKQKYTILHRLIFILLTVALVVVTAIVPTVDAAHRVMTLIALVVFLVIQTLKLVLVMILYHIDKKATFSAEDRVWSIILVILLSGILVFYASWNAGVGFMGQYVRYGDEECTLVYRLNDKDEYEVAGTFRDGNVISVPESFNGKKVVAIDCAFLSSSIEKIRIAAPNIRFDNQDQISELNEDLVIEAYKSNIDAIRLGLFNMAWSTSSSSENAKTLLNSVIPIDLAEGETYYNIDYANADTARALGYLPTTYKPVNETIRVEDLVQNVNNDQKGYFDHRDLTSQADLAWCYDHEVKNNRDHLVLTESKVTENSFLLKFEHVYRFTIQGKNFLGNDDQWNPAPAEKETFVIESKLDDYFDALPTRAGFTVTWWAASDEISKENLQLAIRSYGDGDAFKQGINGAENAYSFGLKPIWKVIPPEIVTLNDEAHRFTITYGQDTEISVLSGCVHPVTYTIKDSVGNVIATRVFDVAADGRYEASFPMLNKIPKDTGVYTLSAIARPLHSSIPASDETTTTQDFTFTVNRKELRLNWTLPSGEFDNRNLPVLCEYYEEDRVGEDVIEVARDLTEAFDAGDYSVTATLSEQTAEKYVISSQATHSATQSFTIEKKAITVEWSLWNPDTFVYNGTVQGPTAKTQVFGVVEYLEVTDLGKNAGRHEARAIAREIGENGNGVSVNPQNYVISQNEIEGYEIAKKVATISSWSTDQFDYDGLVHYPQVITLGDLVPGEELSEVLTELRYENNAAKDSGDYEGETALRVTFVATSNYTFGEGNDAVKSKSYHIEPKVVHFEWQETSFDYNGLEQRPIALAYANDLVSPDTCEFRYTDGKVNAGNYTVTINGVTNANYKLPTDVILSTTFVINKIARKNAQVTYRDRVYGEDVLPEVSGNDEEGEVTYSYFVTDRYVIEAPVNAGSYEIRATIATTTNYLETIIDKPYTISPKPVALSWSAIDDLVYNKTEKVPTATVTNLAYLGDIVTVEAQVTAGKNNVSVGNFTFTAISLDNANYTLTGGTSIVSGVYTITKKTVTLNWETPTEGELIYSGTVKKVTVTALGLEDGDVCSVNSTVQTGDAKNVGTFSYRATSLSNANYALPEEVISDVYEITKKALTITIYDKQITYGDSPANSGAHFEGFVTGESESLLNLKYSYTYTRYGDVGDYEIDMNYTDPSNYAVTLNKGMLSVANKVLGLSWSDLVFTYDGVSHAPTATATGTVNGDTLTVLVSGAQTNVNRDIDHNVVAYVATATSVTGDKAGNYELPDECTTSFRITPKTVRIYADDKAVTYGDIAPTYTYRYSEDAAYRFVDGENDSVLYTSHSLSSDYARYDDAKSYSITVTVGEAQNYEFAAFAGTLTVGQKEIGILWGVDSFDYTGSAQAPVATATGSVNGDLLGVTVSGAQINVKRDGSHGVTSHTATATAITGTKAANYKLPASVTHDFTINPLEVTVTADDKAVTYGDPIPTYTATYVGFVAGESKSVLVTAVSFACDYAVGSSIGDYVITPSGAVATNYEFLYQVGKVAVSKATLTVKADAKSITYGDEAPAYTGTIVGYRAGDTAAVVTGSPIYTCDYVRYDDASAYTITPSITGLVADNYLFSAETATLTVSPKAATVTAENKSTTYGSYAPSFTYVTDGIVNDDALSGTIQYACAYTAAAGNANRVAGNYTITPSGLSNPNYVLTFVAGTLTVNPLTVTVDWKGTSLEYSGVAQRPYAEIGETAYGESVQPVSYSAGNRDVGHYEVSLLSISDQNYAIPTDGSQKTEYSIYAAPLTIVPNDETITYGAGVPTFTFRAEGLLGSDTIDVISGDPDYTCGYSQYDGVGEYPIYVGTGNLSASNYDLHGGEGNLKVEKATLQVKGENKNVTYGDPIPTFTATIEGFKGEDDESVVSGDPSYNCPYLPTSAVGAYLILPGLGTLEADNYSFTFVSAHVVVAEKEIGIDWNVGSYTYNGNEQAPTATATGTVNGDVLSLTVSGAISAGEHTATVTGITGQKAANYKLPDEKSTVFTIEQKEISIYWFDCDLTYSGVAQAPQATAQHIIAGDSIALTVEGAETDPGNYTATVTGITGSAAGNYKLPSEKTTSYEIKRAVVYSIRWCLNTPEGEPIDGFSGIFAGVNNYYTISAVGASDTVQGDVALSLGGDYSAAVPGEYTATASILDTTRFVFDESVTAEEKTCDWNIEKATIHYYFTTSNPLVPNDSEWEYDGTKFGRILHVSDYIDGTPGMSVGLVASGTGAAFTDGTTVITGNGTYEYLAVNAGTYSITPTITSDFYELEAYYEEEATVTFTITPISVTVNARLAYVSSDSGSFFADYYGNAAGPATANDFVYAGAGIMQGYLVRLNSLGATVTLNVSASNLRYVDLSGLTSNGYGFYGTYSDAAVSSTYTVNGSTALLFVITEGQGSIEFTSISGSNYVLTSTVLTVNVRPKTVSQVTWQLDGDDELTTTYDAAAHTMTPTILAKSFAEGLTATDGYALAGDTIALGSALEGYRQTDAGSYVATLKSGDLSAHYTIAEEIMADWSITQADRTAPIVTIAGWTEGDAPADPSVTSAIEEEESTTVTFFYYAEGEDRGDAVTTVPTEAGDYYVFALLSATTNYKGAESESCGFTIANV